MERTLIFTFLCLGIMLISVAYVNYERSVCSSECTDACNDKEYRGCVFDAVMSEAGNKAQMEELKKVNYTIEVWE
jgi:hypothetical protein